MGTQFWWFYDVLVLSVTAGILYASVVRGFNKGVFRLIGFLLAVVVGIFGSEALKGLVYENIFQQEIISKVSTALEDEDWDVFVKASEALALSASDGEETQDTDAFRNAHKAFGKDTYPDWFISSVSSVTEFAVSAAQKPHSQETLAEVYKNNIAGFHDLVDRIVDGQAREAAVMLEETYYRPSYLRMIRWALYLLIQLVVLIVCAIISSIAGNLEEQMHLRKGDHVLGLVVGLAETAGVLLMILLSVRLITTLTDGQMLLFNQETIDATKIFRYIYYL